ncbi:hypothetical protein PAEAM_06390 [Paenibacillus sp. GM1FR]|nr:hypothetical protein [Paenibacillus sp. GM1FR]PJN64553.1 hypothetical protein PAEAM_06390 [Paenibacillus sp. GM1FR]
MIATTNMPTTRNNWEYNNSYKRNFNHMLIFVYCLVLIVKELIA